MKLTHLFAAALMVAGIGVSTEASAQRYDGYSQRDRGDRHDRDDRRYERGDHRWDRRDDRRWDGRDRRWDRRDRGNHYGWRNNRRSDCRIVYRHHQRIRICR